MNKIVVAFGLSGDEIWDGLDWLQQQQIVQWFRDGADYLRLVRHVRVPSWFQYRDDKLAGMAQKGWIVL